MKNYVPRMILTGMIAGFMGFSVNGQERYVDLEILIDEPVDASVVPPDASVPFTLSLTNHGPDELVTGDSVFILLPSSQVVMVTMPAPLAAGNNIQVYYAEMSLNNVESGQELSLCIQLAYNVTWGEDQISFPYTDPNPENDNICHSIIVGEEPPTGVDRFNTKPLRPYPNPAHNFIRIPVDRLADQDLTIRIKDISGRVVLSQELSMFSGEFVEVDIEKLQTGVFIVELYQGDICNVGKVSIVR